MTKQRRAHWNSVYDTKSAHEVSWYQERPEKSLDLIEGAGIGPADAVIDVGGGASTLVDTLLDRGYRDLTVLDVSASALRQSQERLGTRATGVTWTVTDVTRFKPGRQYRAWHDRAVLHFLTEAPDRARYVEVLKSALELGAYAILATFGPDGPEKCSGLPVRRYTVDMMAELLGPGFALQHSELEEHTTPGGSAQQFLFSTWKKCG